jgi:hypothetical protein
VTHTVPEEPWAPIKQPFAIGDRVIVIANEHYLHFAVFACLMLHRLLTVAAQSP